MKVTRSNWPRTYRVETATRVYTVFGSHSRFPIWFISLDDGTARGGDAIHTEYTLAAAKRWIKKIDAEETTT